MKKRRWMIPGVVGLLVWSFGWGMAQAAISAVEPGSAVTLSILQNGRDVTDSWLPEPGQSVELVINGMASPSLSLGPATSAHPGQCTNSGSNEDLTPDFTLTGNKLTPTDCGGIAVITVSDDISTLTFMLPKDSDGDGMPDIWEAKYCSGTNEPTTCLMATVTDSAGKVLPADIDAGPLVGSPTGDGIATFDEYRGFIVSGVHHRLDPRQKDLFVHLVNPQCGTDSLLGGGTTTYPVETNLSILSYLDSLIAADQFTRLHVLGHVNRGTNYTTSEWVDRFYSYSPQSGFKYDGGTTSTPPPDDRRINLNALYPVMDTKWGSTIQKGIRIIECLDASQSSPLGVAVVGTPNGPNANALLYTKRIENYMNGLISSGGAPLKHFTFLSGAWTQLLSGSNPATDLDKRYMISRAIQFLLAMEVGHSTQLTPTVEADRKTSYGNHHAPGTGSNLDQTIVNVVNNKGNSFYIPSLYNGTDQASFKLNN